MKGYGKYINAYDKYIKGYYKYGTILLFNLCYFQ